MPDLDYERYKGLYEQGFVPKQQLDTQEAIVRQSEGIVKADQGQIDNAKLAAGLQPHHRSH